jgi:hypothetical protein
VLAGLIYANWGRESGNIIDPDDQGRQVEGLERLKSGDWGCTLEMDLFVGDNRRLIAYQTVGGDKFGCLLAERMQKLLKLAETLV